MKFVVSYYVTTGAYWDTPTRCERQFDTREEAHEWVCSHTDGWMSNIEIRLIDVEKIKALEIELKELKKGILIEG